MKKYEVIVTLEAGDDIREAFLYIHNRSPLNARRWLKGLYKEIDTLEHFPERCGKARETEFLGEELRQLIYKSLRIVFQVLRSPNRVCVLYVRHAKQRAAGEDCAENK